MIVICDKAQDVIIPAGLGDNPGVVYEKSGVESLNGQQGDLTLKTVNGNELLGEGDVAIDTGVESLNGQKGALTLKTVNGNELTGEGNIEIQAGVESVNGETGAVKIKSVNGQSLVGDGDVQIQAGLKYFELTADKAKEAYDEVANHWDDKSGYTGDYVFRYKKDNGGVYTFSEIGYLRDHSVYFNYLDNAGAYDVNAGNIKFFAIIIWNGGYEFSTYEHDFTIPTKTSQLTNDSAFQTKSEVDTAIENAISGGSGNQNVIVLDGLTQEEVKAIYDKLDKTKSPDVVFVYFGSYSFRTYWDGEGNLNFDVFRSSYDAIELSKVTVTKTGEIYRGSEVQSYTNSCVIQVDSHVNETDPFECSYIGSFLEYLQRVYNKPYAYFIWFKQGYGASTKPAYVPFSLIWDKDPDTEIGPVNIQFTIDGITYKYRNDLTNENTWQYDGKISIYDSHSINGYNGTSLVLGGAALDATDKNKYVAMRSMMGYDTIFNGDNDGSCPYLTITTTDSQMYKVPVVVKCNKQNDSATRATFEFDLNGYHYLYTQDNQGDLTFSFTSKTQIANINSDEVSNIKVLTQSEYDALEPKDPHTMYCIKGQ